MESILAFLDWDAEGSIKHGVRTTFRNLSYKTPLCAFRVIVDIPCATGMMLTAQVVTVNHNVQMLNIGGSRKKYIAQMKFNIMLRWLCTEKPVFLLSPNCFLRSLRC